MKRDITRTEAPARPTRASGRFLLRLDPGLHALLRRTAADAGLSLNDFCVRRLAAPGSSLGAAGVTADALRYAAALFGEALVGLALYGSFARGTATAASDVDLLAVVDRSVRLERDLYRRWGEPSLDWAGHPIEVHFAHLPARDSAFGGFWAEVALDAIVLFERNLELSRALIAVRREILAGRIERRTVQGQPYWIEVA